MHRGARPPPRPRAPFTPCRERQLPRLAPPLTKADAGLRPGAQPRALARVFSLLVGLPPRSPLFPYTTLFRSINGAFLTGDLFNLFVFFEILLIASYGLLVYANGA